MLEYLTNIEIRFSRKRESMRNNFIVHLRLTFITSFSFVPRQYSVQNVIITTNLRDSQNLFGINHFEMKETYAARTILHEITCRNEIRKDGNLYVGSLSGTQIKGRCWRDS